MAKGYLSDRTKISIVSTTTAGAAGQTAITSSAVDMAGFDGCLFIIPVGTLAAGAVTSIKAQQCDTTGGSYADLLGTSQAIADTDDNKCYYIDIQKPQEQFLKCVVSRATGDATIGGIVAIQYQKRSLGTASHGSNVSGEQFNFVAEGTA